MTDAINRQDAVAALEAESVSGETGTESDFAYNVAIKDAIAAINALPAADKCTYCGNTGICGWDDKPQFCGECSHGNAAFKGWDARIPVNALKVVRERAIEECAKVAEGNAHTYNTGRAIAKAIRALAD